MAHSSASRYFKNDNLGQEELEVILTLSGEHASIKDNVMSKLKLALSDMLQDIEKASPTFDSHDITVYTGMTGYALLYLHMYEVFDDRSYLDSALSYISSALQRLKHRRITFLLGDAGSLAVGAVIYNLCGQTNRSRQCLEKLLAMASTVVLLSVDTYDELLFGRAGYLYSLLYVRIYLGESAVPEKVVDDVVDTMIESGKTQAGQISSFPKLMYTWHDSEYIGAAHGYIGILYLLLHINYKRHSDTVKSTLQFVLDLQYPSGNFPSSYGNAKDRLVHWCHGAPGGVYLMIKAYLEFKEEKYLVSAQKASDLVWERGLLKKGYGLCHGISGNGYGFLAMHKLTKDPKYLYRAVQFALWCCDYKLRHGLRTPDRPFSLFEGIAGAAYFLADLLQHEKAKFPAFEL